MAEELANELEPDAAAGADARMGVPQIVNADVIEPCPLARPAPKDASSPPGASLDRPRE